jgi:NAD(P)-dependent dehydrogenase (short-subunit alcohol dehydrogenase family)
VNGKVVLITGGTSGIGRVTARELKRAGATVVVVGRDPVKLDARHDPGEPVARRLRHDGPVADGAPPLRQEPGHLAEGDRALPGGASHRLERAVALPASQRRDRHPQQLGGLPDAQQRLVGFVGHG